MINRFYFVFTLLFFFSFLVAQSQDKRHDERVVFYNVENFFVPVDDPHTQDNDFTPDGKNRWTWSRFRKKRNVIAKTIIATGEGNAPVLVGLCEIENYIVLKHLTERTPLARIGYGIIHHESPDPRGIDVALLYRKDRFNILHSGFHKVTYESGSSQTREIVYAKGIYGCCDTLHIMVNHWPSKLGGEKQSRPKRMAAAHKVKSICDSILHASPAANIIVMGDFNDTPESLPLTEGLEAKYPYSNPSPDSLYNLMFQFSEKDQGSLKYRGNWEAIDQFIISGNLLNLNTLPYCPFDQLQIFDPLFLLEDDEKYFGKKPFRTYEGPRYKGGISDHLPIIMKLQLSSPNTSSGN
jgi:predicted extracellular nuclease